MIKLTNVIVPESEFHNPASPSILDGSPGGASLGREWSTGHNEAAVVVRHKLGITPPVHRRRVNLAIPPWTQHG